MIVHCICRVLNFSQNDKANRGICSVQSFCFTIRDYSSVQDPSKIIKIYQTTAWCLQNHEHGQLTFVISSFICVPASNMNMIEKSVLCNTKTNICSYIYLLM